MSSLATCLQRFGLPSEPLDSSTQATPRLYLGACGLQAVRPRPQELDVSIEWTRTYSPHHTRAWAQSPASFSARSSPSRQHKGRSLTLTSVMDVYTEKPDKAQGLQQLLEKQNTWRRKQESLALKNRQGLLRPQLSEARRKTRILPAAWERASTPGTSTRRPSKEAGEEVLEMELPTWHAMRSPRENVNEFDKAVQVAKSYNFPLREVKARLDDFRRFKNGREVFTIGQFCDEVKDKYDLEHKALLASFRSDENGILDFETFLLWSMKTDFLEEMLVPDAQERRFRQIVREHCLNPSEIDNIRSAYDSFDINGNGLIDHEEFKSLLCKLRMMKAEGDIPAPELKRCWRDACPVEQESQVINFEQFLIWILKSGELARYREMREYHGSSSFNL